MSSRLYSAMVVVVALLLATADSLANPERQRRSRGDGLYHCPGSNTVGSGNLWLTGRGITFVWDNPDSGQGIKPFGFFEVKAEWGILGSASLVVDSRLLSYFWHGQPQMGTTGIGVKATLPNNKDLRLHGAGIEIKYLHSFVEDFPSIAGYRVAGSGFTPEGFVAQGGTFQAKIMYDRDYIAKSSYLPFKVFSTLGIRVPLEKWLTPYSQYLAGIGAAYIGLNFDAFVELGMEGFINRSLEPKRFDWALESGTKVWEVAFPENPVFITPGVRMRYERGTTISLCVPLLISANYGSTMTAEDKVALDRGGFPQEAQRGITDPFDPWYVRWKIVAELSYPILYRETGAEMRRTFLLMKNLKKKPTIDLDKVQGTEVPEDDEAEKNRRLNEIQKRRNEIIKEE